MVVPRLICIRSAALDSGDANDPADLIEVVKNSPIADATPQRVQSAKKLYVALKGIVGDFRERLIDGVALGRG